LSVFAGPRSASTATCHEASLSLRVVADADQHPDALRPLTLLGACGKRPRHRAAEQRDELAACHWPMPPVLPTERIARLSYGRRLLCCLAYDIRFSCGKPL